MVLITVAAPAAWAAQASGVTRAARSGRWKAQRDPGRDADQTLAILYDTHCRSLTRLATLLLNDAVMAEEVVRVSFAGVAHAWRRLGTTDQALLCLRRAVVRRARSHRPAHPALPVPQPPETRAGSSAVPSPGARLSAALSALPATQREAVVLRYYTGLPDSEIASVMGISARSVSGHIDRAVATLRDAIGPGDAAPAGPR